MQITVERIKPTAKSLVLTAGGKEYFAKKESGITAGMTIDAETKDSDYNGKTYTWVEKWKPVAAPQTSGNASGQVSGTAWLPFASNTVAHAINAGLITTPEQVKVWAASAKQAFEELTS